MTESGIYFIYGLCVMFYLIMSWFFWRKNEALLSRLVAILMLVIGLQCIKDLFFISPEYNSDMYIWSVMTSMDMVAVPLYGFILAELCRPGSLTLRSMVGQMIPFVLLPLLFIFTRLFIFFYIEVAWTAIYGGGYAIWAALTIPKYHKILKQRFSYTENINLNWIKVSLLSFFVILVLWIIDCMVVDLNIEAIYLLGSVMIWMWVCYFIYKHESVIDELNEPSDNTEVATIDIIPGDELHQRIRQLFDDERIYLNPQLKLSDVAALTNSNRTYISRCFNEHHGKTFFEFVNEYRVDHAKELLRSTSERMEIVAEQSGFSSRQSFHRVFLKIAGCPPEQYRKEENQTPAEQ